MWRSSGSLDLGPCTEDRTILGSIFGFPYFGKLPSVNLQRFGVSGFQDSARDGSGCGTCGSLSDLIHRDGCHRRAVPKYSPP